MGKFLSEKRKLLQGYLSQLHCCLVLRQRQHEEKIKNGNPVLRGTNYFHSNLNHYSLLSQVECFTVSKLQPLQKYFSKEQIMCYLEDLYVCFLDDVHPSGHYEYIHYTIEKLWLIGEEKIVLYCSSSWIIEAPLHRHCTHT